jgi:hypothetical protein
MGVALREPSRATQGPTCIYRSVTGTRFVTLAVQRASLRSLRAQIRHPRRVGIARLTGYCGTLGRPILYVGVTKGRVVSVSAPCALAAHFAAIAVARLLRGG